VNSNRFSTSETLQLVDDFTGGVRSFTEREGRINYAEKLKDSNRIHDLEEGKELLEKEAVAKAEQARNSADEKRERVKEVSAARKARIDKSQMTVRNSLIASLREEEGHFRYGLQKDMMDAGRKRELAIAETKTEHEKSAAGIHEFDAKLKKMENIVGRLLRGYPSLRKKVGLAVEEGEERVQENEEPDSVRLDSLYQGAGKGVAAFRRQPFPAMFQTVPLWLWIVIVILLGAAASPVLKIQGIEIALGKALTVTGGIVVFILFIYGAGYGVAASFTKRMSAQLGGACRQWSIINSNSQSQLNGKLELIKSEFLEVKDKFDTGLKGGNHGAIEHSYNSAEDVDKRGARLQTKLQEGSKRRLLSIEGNLESRLNAIEVEKTGLLSGLSNDSSETEEDFDAQRAGLFREWKESLIPLESGLKTEASALVSETAWLSDAPSSWHPPKEFREDFVFGNMEFSLESAEVKSPQDEQLSLNSAGEFTVPLRLKFPTQGAILFETKSLGREEAISSLNYMVLSLLAGSPPGRLSFSLFDPVGLGESFAGLMHLADYEEQLINSRIRTQPDQIEQRLGELCDHMEKVIQMYLRNEYATISEYNEKAGAIAERYHFVVIADFPQQFSDEAARRLLSIATVGARCGVFTLIHHDQRIDLPPGFQMEDLRKSSICIRANTDGFFLKDSPISGGKLELIQAPESSQLIEWIHRVGEANRDSNHVEIPFDQIAPSKNEVWSLETASELRVPIGRTGATKLQYLAIGKGTRQHALIAGKTGSGKSTLFHIIIANLALWCDPDQVEFYLIDFKKGVEFKCYADAKLPHARVIAIESDREFGLSVLHRLDEELKQRGEKFRELGVQDVAGYKKAGGPDPVPRTLLMIDEFQEFFVEDDQISQQAAVLLDRIVRQGRAFGIHAILGSQTLGGAFTLARATLGQMVVRIALQCNEADAYLIMDDSNPAPRLLTRPGEGIYNDGAGAVESNSPFQVVWLKDEERDVHLARIAEMAIAKGMNDKPQVIFEGNAPANVSDEKEVSALISKGPAQGTPRLYLGAPNAIKGPTEVGFERQSGSNLMIVGQREDAVEAMIAIGLKLLRAQLGERARIILIDGNVSDPNSQSWLKGIVSLLGESVECPDSHEIGGVINELAAGMKAKGDGITPIGDSSTYIFVLGLQRYKKLRFEEDFSFSLDDDDAEKKASDSFNDLICEGPALGYHMIISLDTYNNVNRCISRKALAEFEKKVLFQMSAADSASLIDSGKAGNLGMNRALYFNEPTGVIETFRPFAQPADEWFK